MQLDLFGSTKGWIIRGFVKHVKRSVTRYSFSVVLVCFEFIVKDVNPQLSTCLIEQLIKPKLSASLLLLLPLLLLLIFLADLYFEIDSCRSICSQIPCRGTTVSINVVIKARKYLSLLFCFVIFKN